MTEIQLNGNVLKLQDSYRHSVEATRLMKNNNSFDEIGISDNSNDDDYGSFDDSQEELDVVETSTTVPENED